MPRELINETLTANGSTTEATVNQTGMYAFAAVGPFGSGTVTVSVTPKNQSSASTLSQISYASSKVDDLIFLAQGEKVKADLTGATSPSIKFTLTWTA